MWSQTYGGSKDDFAESMVQTSDGGFALAGYTYSFGVRQSDFWLVKTDMYGNMEWNRTYRFIGSERVYSLVETSDGGYALAGDAYSISSIYPPSPPGSYRILLYKTDENGKYEWSRKYGRGVASSIVETSDGGFALAGGPWDNFWLVKTDMYGNMEWNQTYGRGGAYSLVETSDGGYALAGYKGNFGALDGGFWLVKTDKNGNVEWHQTYGGRESFERAYSLVETSDGGYALAGSSSISLYTTYFWLVKTDENGNMEWNQTYGRGGAYSLVETSDGGFALAGYTNSSGGPWDNFWLVKTDENGNMEWNQTYGGTNSDYAKAIVQTSDGGFALAGTTSSFGAGGRDFWLVKTESMYDEADENGAIPQSPSLIAATIVIAAIAVVGVAILVYLKRIEKKRNRVTFTHG